MLQRCTKGASKHRRELINAEISKIADLLPTAENARSHLSQLQVLSLCKTYIAKCNFFESVTSPRSCLSDNLAVLLNSQYPDHSELLPGFLIVVTLDGKVLYLSENVIEYLEHSMVEVLTHIETLYDLVDRRDYKLLDENFSGMKSGVHSQDGWSFSCRMGLTKKFHQNFGFHDWKSMIVRGFVSVPHFNPEFSSPVFVALCTPRLKTGVASNPQIIFDTMIFESLHGLDMKYRNMGSNGEVHLGYSVDEIRFRSWYGFIHPDDSSRAVAVVKNVLYCDSQSRCPLFVRMQRKDGHLLWMSIFMKKVKSGDGGDGGGEGIVCLNQIVREQDIINECEAGLLRASSSGRDFLSASSEKSCVASLAAKCSREEVLERLKRKMQMNEMKRTNAFLPSKNVSRSQHSSPKETASVFSFEIPQKKKSITTSRSQSVAMNMQRNLKSSLAAVDCFSFSPSVWHDSASSSYSSSSSLSSSLGSVFQGGSSLTPTSNLSSPSSFGLSVLCPVDDVNVDVTSMPTPKFDDASKYQDYEVFETGYQGEEAANVVEMLEGRQLHDGLGSLLASCHEEKRTCELPVLCPGSVDDFFREFEVAPLSTGIESMLRPEEDDCLIPLAVNSQRKCLSSSWKTEKNWSESNAQAHPSPEIRNGFAIGHMHDQEMSAFEESVLVDDNIFQFDHGYLWNGFSHFLKSEQL